MIRRFSAAVVALLAAGVVWVGTSTTADAAVSPQVFGCADGAVLDHVVPSGVTSVRVRAEGGGSGGVVEATVAVEPGRFLGVLTGCADGAGYHWGGSGGAAKDGSCADGAPGAGSSAVLTGDYDEVIVEAGGRGGTGGQDVVNQVGPVTSAKVSATTEIPVVATLSATVSTVVADRNDNELADTGDELRYTVVVTNTGTVTLTDVTTVDCAAAGEQVRSEPSSAVTTLAQQAGLTVTNTVTAAGTTLTYPVTTTNSGNVTLEEVVPALTPATLTCAPVTLAPGATTTCRTTYSATGPVTATATASGTAPQASPALAWTGVTAVTEMIIAGVVVLALGLGLLLFTRRKRRDE